MFRAQCISEFKPIQIERDQIAQRGCLDIVQLVHARLVTLQNRRVDEIWLKNADVDAWVSADRIPSSRASCRFASAPSRSIPRLPDVSTRSAYFESMRAESGRVAGPLLALAARAFGLHFPRLALHVSQENVTEPR